MTSGDMNIVEYGHQNFPDHPALCVRVLNFLHNHHKEKTLREFLIYMQRPHVENEIKGCPSMGVKAIAYLKENLPSLESIDGPPVETGWLIETAIDGRPHWWNGHAFKADEWTCDSLQAIRFARKEDAEVVMARCCVAREPMSATEHQWGPL
jgi:hypothetical protein